MHQGMQGSILRTLSVIVLVMSFEVARAQCPCRHKGDGLKHLTSSQPLDPRHVQCLRPVDAHIDWMREAVQQSRAELTRSALADEARRLAALDWTIPTADDLRPFRHVRNDVISALKDLEAARRAPASETSDDDRLVAESNYRHLLALEEYVTCVVTAGIAR